MSTRSCIRSPIFSRISPPASRPAPTFREALETQAVCDAVLDSAEVGEWQTVVPTA